MDEIYLVGKGIPADSPRNNTLRASNQIRLWQLAMLARTYAYG